MVLASSNYILSRHIDIDTRNINVLDSFTELFQTKHEKPEPNNDRQVVGSIPFKEGTIIVVKSNRITSQLCHRSYI